MFLNVKSPLETPDAVTKIAIEFNKGIPVKVVNHSDQTVIEEPVALVQYLNWLGAENGIGRLDIVESRFIGIKSRGVYETPGGTILHHAHLDLETCVMDKEVLLLKMQMLPKVAQLIYNGFWFSTEMKFLMKAINESQECVSGTIEMLLYKGNVIPIARHTHANRAIFSRASMEESEAFNQQDATGFIQIQSLR